MPTQAQLRTVTVTMLASVKITFVTEINPEDGAPLFTLHREANAMLAERLEPEGGGVVCRCNRGFGV